MSDHISDRNSWVIPCNDVRQHFEFLMLHPSELRKHVLKLRLLSALGLLRLIPSCPGTNYGHLLLQSGPAVKEVSEEMLRQLLCDEVTLLKLQERIWGGEAGSYWSRKIENELDAESRLELDLEVEARIKATVAARVREAFSEDPIAESDERIERATAGTSRQHVIQSLNSLARKKDRSFRPWLESLEERNAPGGFGPLAPPSSGLPHPPPPPGLVVNQTSASNVAGDGNSVHINNSFNNTASVVGAGLLSASQVGNVEVHFALSSLLAAETSNINAGTIMEGDFALAIDHYLLLPANSGVLSISGINSQGTDGTSLTKTMNTQETSLPFIAPVIGDLTFNSLVAVPSHI